MNNRINTEIVEVNRAMWAICQHLDEALSEFESLAFQKSKTEREYRKAKAVSIVTQRKNNVPTAVLSDIVAGEISQLKYERDLANELYKVKQLEIENARAKLSAMQSISRTMGEL